MRAEITSVCRYFFRLVCPCEVVTRWKSRHNPRPLLRINQDHSAAHSPLCSPCPPMSSPWAGSGWRGEGSARGGSTTHLPLSSTTNNPIWTFCQRVFFVGSHFVFVKNFEWSASLLDLLLCTREMFAITTRWLLTHLFKHCKSEANKPCTCNKNPTGQKTPHAAAMPKNRIAWFFGLKKWIRTEDIFIWRVQSIQHDGKVVCSENLLPPKQYARPSMFFLRGRRQSDDRGFRRKNQSHEPTTILLDGCNVVFWSCLKNCFIAASRWIAVTFLWHRRGKCDQITSKQSLQRIVQMWKYFCG